MNAFKTERTFDLDMRGRVSADPGYRDKDPGAVVVVDGQGDILRVANVRNESLHLMALEVINGYNWRDETETRRDFLLNVVKEAQRQLERWDNDRAKKEEATV
jgi:hypothetical protein